jgi:hypothetical protein
MKSAQEEQRPQEDRPSCHLEDLIIRDPHISLRGFIIRGPDMSLRSLAQEMSNSRTDVSKMVSEDLK